VDRDGNGSPSGDKMERSERQYLAFLLGVVSSIRDKRLMFERQKSIFWRFDRAITHVPFSSRVLPTYPGSFAQRLSHLLLSSPSLCL
jgi:hypothetical protein